MEKKTVLVVATAQNLAWIERGVQGGGQAGVVVAQTAEEVKEACSRYRIALVIVEDGPQYLDLVSGCFRGDAAVPPLLLFLGGGEDSQPPCLGGYAFSDYLVIPCSAKRFAAKVELLLSFYSFQEQLRLQEALLEDKNLEIEVLLQELEEKNDEIEQLSSLDGLTGLFNRHYFSDNLHKEWRQAVRQNEVLSLLLIDVDYLREYNEHYGYGAGDRCLQDVARALHQALLRPVDIVARYGGDQFAAILPATREAGATQVAKRMMDRVTALEIDHQASACCEIVSVSIGAATLTPKRSDKLLDLLMLAERTLALAKNAGRNCLRSAGR